MRLNFAKQRNMQVLGIIGGMGPAASNYMAQLVVDSQKSHKDQDRMSFVLINNPNIPDRTNFLKGSGPSPVPGILRSIKMAKRAGATMACITCNTAHSPQIFDRISKKTSLPIVSLVDVTVSYIKKSLTNGAKVGILATDGTNIGNAYRHSLIKAGLEPVLPSIKDQKVVMDIIYNVKAEGVNAWQQKELNRIINGMQGNGVRTFILGCTELSMLDNVPESVIAFDPLKIAAKNIVNELNSVSKVKTEKALGSTFRRILRAANIR